MRGARRWGVLAVAWRWSSPSSDRPAARLRQAERADRDRLGVRREGSMAPFDGPALATAKIRVKEVNAKGGVNGRMLRLDTCDTEQQPCACQVRAEAARQRCGHHLHDVRRRLRYTGCAGDQPGRARDLDVHRHRSDGPKRFGKTKGRPMPSFGNVAQDEARPWPSTRTRGWRTAGLGTNTLLVYFKNVVQAFDKRVHAAGRPHRRA